MQGPGAHTRQDAKRQEGHRSKKKPVHGPQRREMKRSEQTRDSGKGRSEFCRPHRGHGPWQPMPRGGGGGGSALPTLSQRMFCLYSRSKASETSGSGYAVRPPLASLPKSQVLHHPHPGLTADVGQGHFEREQAGVFASLASAASPKGQGLRSICQRGSIRSQGHFRSWPGQGVGQPARAGRSRSTMRAALLVTQQLGAGWRGVLAKL